MFKETENGQTHFDPEAERLAREEKDPFQEARKHKFLWRYYNARAWIEIRIAVALYRLGERLIRISEKII
jgi:hypothetical protein